MQAEPISNIKDEEIIAGLEGENLTESVKHLYRLYFAGIVEFVEYRGGSQEDGADIFQESILVIIDKIRSGKFRGESSIKTFLFGIARNLWLMEVRTRERRKKREEYYMTKEPLVEEITVMTKSGEGLQAVFSQIGDICKSILIGVYFENKSMKMLLQEFDFKNEQVLRNRKNLCMKKFKEILSTNINLMKSLKTDYVYE